MKYNENMQGGIKEVMDDIIFLCNRLKELREINGYSMEKMGEVLGGKDSPINKSSISRMESGQISSKNIEYWAKEYCKVFNMSSEQTEQFLRGEKIAVPDTSALLKNTTLIEELEKEYGKVILPNIVIDELDIIKNNYKKQYSKGLSRRAWEVLRAISTSEKAITVNYNGNSLEDNDDSKIIYIAKNVSKQYNS